MFGQRLPHLLGRFRTGKAEVGIVSSVSAPPDELSGGVACLTVTLVPKESFRIRTGRLELVLLATRFSRTTLDGYYEHTSRDVRRACLLWEDVAVQPGVPLERTVRIPLPEPPAADTTPVRLQWEVRARFAAAGYREFGASLVLGDASVAGGAAPVVDGTGFLPLYEFRERRDS